MQAKSILTLILLMLATISCEKISNETDPQKIILGKWKLIEIGNGDNMEVVPDPGGYIEYLPDSIKIEHSIDSPESFQKNFWIDSLLNERVYFQEQHRWVNTGRYRYEFFDKNKKMRLDFVLGIAELSTSIYKRIK
jgi:hypothetical protein